METRATDYGFLVIDLPVSTESEVHSMSPPMIARSMAGRRRRKHACILIASPKMGIIFFD